MSLRNRVLLALVAVLLALPVALAALEVPYLSGRVVDEADLLDGATEERLITSLEQIERQTGAQVVVLTVPTLEGEVLEDYSLRVAETWGLGRADLDDGLLVLVSRDDRKIRLEVGYGLEANVPDILARRIIDERMVPRFREGDFGGGIEAAVETLGGLIEGNPDAMPPPPPRNNPNTENPLALIFVFLPFLGMALMGRGPNGWCAFLMICPFILTFSTVFVSPTVAGILVVVWLVIGTFVRLTLPDHLKIEIKGGVSGSSSGGGWSSGGGGFSGGGGSFGGGGASGSW
jgi:uncharacterized protein